MSTRQFLIYFFLLTWLLCFSCQEKPKVNRISSINIDSVSILIEDSAYIMKTLQNVQKLLNTHTDSLRKTGFDMLNKSKNIDFTKGIAESYYTIAEAYWGWNIYDSAIYYCKKALKNYESIHDTLSMAHKLYKISFYYSVASRIEEAIDAINKSRYYYECVDNILKIYECAYAQFYYQNQLQNIEKQEAYLNDMAELIEKLDEKSQKAHFYIAKADYFVDKANLKPAMDLYYKAVKASEEVKDSFQLSKAYGGIANVNYILKDYKTAIKYYLLQKNIFLSNEVESQYHLGNTYNCLGQCYNALGEIDTAKEYLRKSLVIRQRIKYNLETASTLNNLAFSHYKKGDSLDIALAYLDESLELNHGIENNEGVATDLVLKGKIYYKKKNYYTAIRMAGLGLEIAEKYNLPVIIIESTNLLGLVYADLGHYQKAYHFITRSNRLNDSLLTGEDHKKITQLEMQRSFDEKQKETELKHLQENLQMEAELKRNKLVKNFSIVAGLLFILLGVFIFRSFIRSRRSEKEKEILLKEIHHRVKNNLQIISSLLNLQSGTLSDDLNKTAVIESRSRVKSMALIHQLLYQSEMFTNINFASYLEQLMSSLHSTYCKPGENIQYKISAEPILLDIDIAIPLGLIINELATNAYKYAFPEKKEGNIEISLIQQSGHNILLSIADNGIGLPEKIDIQKTNSLGLRLVNLLVKQLKANINHERKNGTIIKIWIPSAA